MAKNLFSLAVLAALTAAGCSKGGGDKPEGPVNVLDKISDNVFRAHALACMAEGYSGIGADGLSTPHAKWDIDGDGKLSTSEAAEVTSIVFGGSDDNGRISGMAGLEYFTGLVSLAIAGNELRSLDVEGCTKLAWLMCADNKIATLRLPSGDALKTVFCYTNQLTSLDASACTGLERLTCDGNRIATLLLPAGDALVEVLCADNPLASIDVSACTGLGRLSCGDGGTTPLVVTVANGISLTQTNINARNADNYYDPINSLGTAVFGVRLTLPGALLVGEALWASANVDVPGEFAASPENPGMYYQWGRRVGWSASDPLKPTVEGTQWDADYTAPAAWQAADDPCPAGWRVPKRAEMESLFNETAVTRTWSDSSPKGYTFKDKISGNSIFLPIAGYRDWQSGAIVEATAYGSYWLSVSSINNGTEIYFDGFSHSISNSHLNYGNSVRCVKQ